MANDGGVSAAHGDRPLLQAEEDIALEEPHVFWLIVSRMHIFGCACCVALYVMTKRMGVEAIDGWWIVCAPFFFAFPYSRYRLHAARAAMRLNLKQE